MWYGEFFFCKENLLAFMLVVDMSHSGVYGSVLHAFVAATIVWEGYQCLD